MSETALLPATGSTFLEVAGDIGSKLCDQARDHGDGGCTWPIPDLRNQDGDSVSMGPYLYRGTAGIALFLIRLHRRLPRPELLETARRALHTSLHHEEAQDKACGGFYNGTGGLIATLLEMHDAEADPRWLEEALRLGNKLSQGLKFPGGLDLIAGEAGSLLGLLHLHQATGDGASLEAARRLGDLLLAQCRREPEGISWDILHPQVVRNLLGLSHGAGGIGMALLELYRFIDDPRYLVAAIEALRYEDSFPGAATGQWPDLRHDGLMGYLESGDVKGLTRDLRNGSFQKESELSAKMAVWCHGAPGIALVRARFLELTGDVAFASGLRWAAERTLEVVESRTPESHSLCHGRCGNADILLDVGRRLGEPTWVEAALAVARRGLDEVVAREKPWKSGYRDCQEAPGLLLGDAGVGLFYLRCADPQVPGCLLPFPLGQDPAEVSYDRELVTQGITSGYLAHLPMTRQALQAHGRSPQDARIDSAEALIPTLERLVADIDDATPKLDEILRIEGAAFRLLSARTDFTAPYLQEQLRHPEAVDDSETWIQLPGGSVLIRGAFDWGVWIEGEEPPGDGYNGGDRAVDPLASVPGKPVTYLLHEVDHRTRIRPLDPLAAAMYEHLEVPGTVRDLLRHMVEYLASQGMVDVDHPQAVAAVENRLRQILRRAAADGMIEVVGSL